MQIARPRAHSKLTPDSIKTKRVAKYICAVFVTGKLILSRVSNYKLIENSGSWTLAYTDPTTSLHFNQASKQTVSSTHIS